jgi:predicted nuclease of restriction endonuclease-like (RecB) superfamily
MKKQKKTAISGQIKLGAGKQNVPRTKHRPQTIDQPVLFDRVVGILEQARAGVVRAVNSHMVLAYWLIGREIVQEIQGGKGRADYGQGMLADLSRKLTARYGAGFSETTLQYFRKFYQVYADRCSQIPRPVGVESSMTGSAATIPRPVGVESVFTPPAAAKPAIRRPAGDELLVRAKSSPADSNALIGFSPQLSWSHYRALMRVEKSEAREFYEREAIAGQWDKRTLERQIQSFYYERLLKSRNPRKLLASGRQSPAVSDPVIESLKDPYVLEFLALPELAALQESDVESAILSRLQVFLLELGKGFAFVARQKRLRFEEDDRYVDLVFYHCQLRFYLLIDLKIGELTHGDVGQMDGYVRMFDELVATDSDNPTIGLILCTEKNEAVAKYSVLKDRKQIFASKYMLYLPTEEELRREIERERRLIEDRTEAAGDNTKRQRKTQA